MRELDRESIDLTRDLQELESNYVARVRKRVSACLPVASPSLLAPNQSSNSSSSSSSSNSTNAGIITSDGDGDTSSTDTEGSKLLEEILTLRTRVAQRLAEKTAIASNMVAAIELFTRKVGR